MVIGIDASRANVGDKTGTEWYSWHLIRALAPRLQAHQVRLYSRETLESGLSNLGHHVSSRVLAWPPGILWSHLRLSWELLWHRPDVLFVPADTVPIIHPQRTYTTIHDVAFERFPELYRQSSVQRRLGWLRPLVHFLVRLFTLGRFSASEVDYHRWSVRHAIRASRKILSVSEFTKQEMVDLLGAAPEQIVVTGQGVPQPNEWPQVDPMEAQQTLRRLQLPQRYLLFVGRWEVKKNIKQLIDGYLQYRRSSSDPIDLVLVGSPGLGWLDVANQIEQSGAAVFIHTLPWQPATTLQTLYRQATLFVFLSAYEGFGRPPLESLSAGVPVVASRRPSLPEVLGPAAYYVDPGDPQDVARGFERMTTDQALRQQILQAGFARLPYYTWDVCAKKTTSILVS